MAHEAAGTGAIVPEKANGASPARTHAQRTTIRFTPVNHTRLRILMDRFGVDMNTVVNLAVAELFTGSIERPVKVAPE